MRNAVLVVSIFFFMQTSSFAMGPKLVYGESQRADQLNPYTSHEASAQRISDLIFDSLVEVNKEGIYLPVLAKSYQVSDRGTDVVFTLRDDVRWHKYEGVRHRFLAKDVLTTVALVLNHDSDIANKSRFESIKDARDLPGNRLLISFKKPLEDPLKYLTFKILPSFVFDASKSLSRDSKFSAHPIGTGPYKFVGINSSGQVELERNKGYFGDDPSFEAIVMKPYTDQAIMTQALMYQSLDLLTYVSPRRTDEVAADRNLQTQAYDSLSYSFVAINTAKKHLSHKLFRQALSHLPNREEMLAAFFSSRGSIVNGPFPPSSWAYNIDVNGFEYNLATAKSAFKSLDMSYSSSGDLLDPSGEPVQFDFLIPIAGENEMNKRIAVAMASYFKKAGINLQLKFVDWLTWKTKVLKERDYDLTIAAWRFDDAANVNSLFHSSELRPWGNNFVQLSNPTIDKLLSESLATDHFAKKTAIYHKLHSVISDEAPYIFLWNLDHNAAYKSDLMGVEVDPFSFFRYVKNWKWRSDGQVL